MQNATDRQTHRQTHRQAQSNMPSQLLRSWGHNNNPDPVPEDLKSVIVTEAECSCMVSLDKMMSLSDGVDYIPKRSDSSVSVYKLIDIAIKLQCCLHCLKSGKIETKMLLLLIGLSVCPRVQFVC